MPVTVFHLLTEKIFCGLHFANSCTSRPPKFAVLRAPANCGKSQILDIGPKMPKNAYFYSKPWICSQNTFQT